MGFFFLRNLCAMEVSAEAKRIMVVALGKLYSSRTQRGGLRLHRSLLLTLVMKSARDMYHAAHLEQECAPQPEEVSAEPAREEPQNPGEIPASLRAEEEVEAAEVVSSSPAEELPGGVDNNNNDNSSSPAQPSRKRRGKAAAEPDFLPCKKAKLEGNLSVQLAVTSALMDYVNCGGDLVVSPSPIPLQRAVAVC